VSARTTAALCFAATVVVALAGCGGDDESEQPRRTVVVKAWDVSPEKPRLRAPARTRAGLVDIRLDNDGDTLHDAQLFRIEGDRSIDDLTGEWLEALDSDPKPKWARPEGGVAPVKPGDSATVTQVLKPGRYLIVDTQEREGVWPTTNGAKGGFATLEVAGRPKGELPETSASITAHDDGFEADGVGAGEQEVTFTNAGEQLHHVVALPLPGNAPFSEAAEAVREEQQFGTDSLGWIPVNGVDRSRSTTVLESGGSQVAELDLKPGRYALVCVVSDRKGGESHFAKGLATELNVE
jgi:hypothetical protein